MNQIFSNQIEDNVKIRILLVDDHEVLLDSLQVLFQKEQDIEVAGTAENGLEALNKLEQLAASNNPVPVDLILMDIRMPIMDGLEATQRVKSLYPNIKVLILSNIDYSKNLQEIIEIGADGYVSKNKRKKDFMEAIRRVYNNEFVVYADTESNSFIISQPRMPKFTFPNFSPEERQVIYYLVREHTLGEIARLFAVSVLVVDHYKKRIQFKLKVCSTTDIVRLAIQHQLYKGTRLPLKEEFIW